MTREEDRPLEIYSKAPYIYVVLLLSLKIKLQWQYYYHQLQRAPKSNHLAMFSLPAATDDAASFCSSKL
jgi:hypothetical protein